MESARNGELDSSLLNPHPGGSHGAGPVAKRDPQDGDSSGEAGSRGEAARLRRVRLLPAEALEARMLLAVSWDGGAGTNAWFDAANWSGDTLPGPSDDVIIDAASPGGSTITLPGGTATINSLQSAKSLNISGGSLSIAATSKITADLTLSSGTLGGAGVLTVGGTLTWSGGTMSGSGTTVAQGGLTLLSVPNSYTTLYLDQRTLDNQGAAVFLASTGVYNSALYLSSGATFDNQAAGSFDFRGDNLFVEASPGTSAGGTFDNEGR